MKRRFIMILMLLFIGVDGNSVKYFLSITGLINCKEGVENIFEFGSYYSGRFIKVRNLIEDSVVISGSIGIGIKVYVSIDSLDDFGIIYGTKTERVGVSSFLIRNMKLIRKNEVIYDFLKDVDKIDVKKGCKVEKKGDSVIISVEYVKRSEVGIDVIGLGIKDSIVLKGEDSLDIDYDYEMYFIEKESKSINKFDKSKKSIIKMDIGKGDLLGRKVKYLKRSNCVIEYGNVNKKTIWFK